MEVSRLQADFSHHPQEVLLAQFSLYVHKGGLKPDSCHDKPILFFDLVNEYRHWPHHMQYKNERL